MHLSRSSRRSPAAGRNVELLEPRCLLSAAATASIPSQSLVAGQAAQTLSLDSFFQDSAVPAGDTVVDIQTNLPAPNNHIPVMLTNSATPQTVNNFLAYINSGEYANTIVHRSVASFVIQAGGYTTDGNHINTFGTIPGESSTEAMTNIPGTLAMALSTGPDSATSEWFINLANNSFLNDTSDGGPFTVFGQTMYNGLTVANNIASLPIVNDTTSSAWNTLPVHNFLGTSGQTVASVPASDFVILNPVVVDGGLNYKVTSSNPRIVSASASGGSLSLTPVAKSGTAKITVTATDLGGTSVSSTFTVSVAATSGPASLSPTLSGHVPASVIAGQKTPIHQLVTITNSGGSTYTGSTTVQLYLSTSTSIDGSAIALPPQVTRTLNIPAGRRAAVAVNLTSVPASVPAGTYNVLAQVIDSSGTATVAASTSTLSVVEPQIDLAVSVARFTATAKSGKHFNETIKITNDGNIPATGTLPIVVETSPDGNVADATVLTTITRKINLAANRSLVIPLPLVAPASGTDYLIFVIDPNNTFSDVNLSNNLVVSALPLTIS
jgi:peptidyl-prolyl cis-trans isomerase A (cyclophilin A)